MIVLDLDQRFDHRIYTYDRINGHKMLMLQGISAEQKGNYQVAMDSALTLHQTVVLSRGDDWEIVLELRPRQFTPLEKLKISK